MTLSTAITLAAFGTIAVSANNIDVLLESAAFVEKPILEAKQVRPNVLFFLADDWGFNDIGYNGNTDTQTPFISSLARKESLIISQHYATPLCSVTRCALLTGRYPMRYGLQSEAIFHTSNYALSRYETLLSNEFQSQGYSTHLIGFSEYISCLFIFFTYFCDKN